MIKMLRGLPGSGKTTYAREQLKGWTRINFDDLRSMMHDGKYSKDNEQLVQQTAYEVVRQAVRRGQDVVWDNTSFNPMHQRKLEAIANTWGVEFEVVDFDIGVEECIRRDAARDNPVGERVIRGMVAKWELE